jgi:hypothetical protein
VAGRLAAGLAAGDILVLHDGVATGARRARPAVLDALPPLIDAAARSGLRPVTLASACGEGLPR